MKRTLHFAVSAALAGIWSVPAFAQDQTRSGTPDRYAQMQTGQTAQQPAAEAGVGTDGQVTNSTATDMAGLEALLASGTNASGTISTITSVSNIKVVKTAGWARGDTQAYDTALHKNAASISALQTALSANKAVDDELSKSGIAASEVLATQINADGSLTMYVR